MRQRLEGPGRERLNLAAHNLLRRLARRCGLDVVRADFNSPIVATEALSEDLWRTPIELPGLELHLEAQREMVENRLAPLLGGLEVPLRGPERTSLALHNPWYGPMDMQSLYAMVRDARPDRVLELGSGFSSLVIDRALADGERGAAAGQAEHIVVDPFPSPVLEHLRPSARVRVESAAEVDGGLFERLEPGDVLFVDTSHVVRPGGEVTRVVLELLPRLAAGVLIHFHDIFLPYPYPRILYDRYNVHWQEQYLLAAFLAFNPRFAVRLSNHALWRAWPEWAKATFRGLEDGMEPSAFWFVRTPVA